MPLLDLECTYCGKKWQENVFKKRPNCPVCKDSGVRGKKVDNETRNFFGYPEDSKIADDDLPFWGMDGD